MTTPLFAIQAVVLAELTGAPGTGTAIMASLRKVIIGTSGGLLTTCLALCSLFCLIKVARIAADIMQDKQGGFGNVPLRQILRPILIMTLLVGYPQVIGLLDTTANMLGGGVAGGFERPATQSTSKFTEAYNKAYEQIENERDTNLEHLQMKNEYDNLKWYQFGKHITMRAELDWYDIVTGWKAFWHGVFSFCAQVPGFICGWLFAIAKCIMMTMCEVQLSIMAAYGCIALAFSALDPWKQSFTGFIGKYITVCLWKPIISVIEGVGTSAAVAVGNMTTVGSGDVIGVILSAIMGCVTMIAAIHMVWNVGSIANDVYNLGTAGGGAGAAAGAVGKRMKMA